MENVKKELSVANNLWNRWQRWLADDSFWPDHSSFIHEDLHPPYILIDKDEYVCGILDWTEAKVSDPGKDFVLYATIFGEKELQILLMPVARFGRE
nr:phosphotransferase [Metabacillus idriensis]